MLQFIDGPRGDLRVAEITVRHIKPTPVEGFTSHRIGLPIRRHPIDGQHHRTPATILEHVARIVRALAGQLCLGVRHSLFRKWTPPLVDAVIFLEQLRHRTVQHFARTQCLIARLAKGVGQQLGLRGSFFNSYTIVGPHPCARRHQSAEHRRPRRVASRCRTMRVSEQYSAFGQAIHVRRQRLRMPLKATNPVIQIIDCDE